MPSILATFYSLHSLLVLSTYSLTNAEYKSRILRKDLSSAGISAIHPLYVLTDLEGNSSVECALNCLIYSPECAALSYSGSLKSCKLLRCHRNDDLVDDSAVEDDWVYWEVLDACEEGWNPLDGHCYYLAQSRMTWNSAVDFCTNRGSYLMEFNSNHESRWVTESFLLPINDDEVACPNHWICSFWIGASFSASSDEFVWNYNGGNVEFPEWSFGEPNNMTGNQNCVSIGRTGKADDQYCGLEFQFVCEKSETNDLI